MRFRAAARGPLQPQTRITLRVRRLLDGVHNGGMLDYTHLRGRRLDARAAYGAFLAFDLVRAQRGHASVCLWGCPLVSPAPAAESPKNCLTTASKHVPRDSSEKSQTTRYDEDGI